MRVMCVVHGDGDVCVCVCVCVQCKMKNEGSSGKVRGEG